MGHGLEPGEPVNASPVVIEGAVLAAGTFFTRGTPAFDLVRASMRSDVGFSFGKKPVGLSDFG
jgi:hypothetical protein